MLLSNVPPQAELLDNDYLSFGIRVMAIPESTYWKIRLQNYVETQYALDVDLRYCFNHISQLRTTTEGSSILIQNEPKFECYGNS